MIETLSAWVMKMSRRSVVICEIDLAPKAHEQRQSGKLLHHAR